MQITDDALILQALPHGEHGVVARVLTRDHGLRSGYVAGGRGRRARAALQPGTRVRATLRSRTTSQLAQLGVEPVASRALLAFEPRSAAALDWLTRLLAATLPEDEPHPALFDALDGLLDAMAGPAQAWLPGVPRLELMLMAELGFGLDLSRCALTGANDHLTHVSPKTGRAVTASAMAGEAWADRLLPLPAFLTTGGPARAGEVTDAFALTGHFLPRLNGVTADLLDGPRQRLARTKQEQLAAEPAAAR